MGDSIYCVRVLGGWVDSSVSVSRVGDWVMIECPCRGWVNGS